MTKPNRTTQSREDGLAKLQREMRVLVESGAGRPMLSPTHPGIIALKRALKSMRRDDQGGYVNYEGSGRWSFAAASVGHFTPEEHNALFDLAGIVPDEIVSKGCHEDCKHASSRVAGEFVIFSERGYTGHETLAEMASLRKCGSCQRPKMSNFEPRKTFPANRGFWCFYCGKVFAKREDRDTHSRIREVMPGKACA